MKNIISGKIDPKTVNNNAFCYKGSICGPTSLFVNVRIRDRKDNFILQKKHHYWKILNEKKKKNLKNQSEKTQSYNNSK